MYEDEPAMKPGLAECENAVLVPHIASATEWTRSGMATLAAGGGRMGGGSRSESGGGGAGAGARAEEG